ncbi:MAG TPA: rhodanese-like domain-containing protein [Kiritimatiellia bacterium]|mgnify:CR=1 FL=1|nr:rhodanese-like domain-containing protein [Kiritimatiellia bacterium]
MYKFLHLKYIWLAAWVFVASGCARADTNVWERIDKGVLVIDVRTVAEFNSGHLDGAINIPHEKTDALAAVIGSDMSREVVLYCRSGRRSGIAMNALRQRGYEKIINGGSYAGLLSTRPAQNQ